jgi:hypothetical protein
VRYPAHFLNRLRGDTGSRVNARNRSELKNRSAKNSAENRHDSTKPDSSQQAAQTLSGASEE